MHMPAYASPGQSRRAVLGLLGGLPFSASGMLPFTATARAGASARRADAPGPPADTRLAAAIQEIINRPAFRNSRWGIQFSWPTGGTPIYALNSDQPFIAASAAKVFTAATAFSTLGPDYRFHTRAYRCGPVIRRVLHGDLLLVAGGDLFLSSRVQPDGSIALPEPDHSYDTPDAKPIPGDPLRVIRELAGQIASHGLRRVTGRVLVDASLFREAKVDIGVGVGPVTVSPMMINDNIVDITVTPGGRIGAPGVLQVSPQTSYLRIVNQVTTASDASTARPLSFVGDVTGPDGTHVVTLTGDIPASTQRLYHAYYIPDPVRFAQVALIRSLRDIGVDVATDLPATVGAPVSHYATLNQLAQHVSPPLSQEVKVMLKTSSNLHTVMYPYLVGAIAGHDRDNATAVYDQFKSRLFEQAGLTPPAGSEYTPDFFAKFLAYETRQPYFGKYHQALPIMGKDGSLADVQVNSPAAGHVYAKTGTGISRQSPTSSPAVDLALAGYLQLPDLRWMVFAQFMHQETTSPDTVTNLARQAMGEIATAAYQALGA
jgi:D-alanyl-D-alanine carboxypeptidase/D-alanyl-D-alanine-endopeptidase (penicillin-binding protein 4)